MSKKLAMLDANGLVINLAMFEDDVIADGVTLAVPRRTTRVGDKVQGGVLVDAPPLVPEYVTKLQLVRALRQVGLWGDVKSAIKTSGTETKEDWELSHVIDRGDSLVIGFATAIPITPAEMDDLFRTAATL